MVPAASTTTADLFVVDPERCTECVGAYDSPRCVEVCPVECIIADADHAETRDELHTKYAHLHGTQDSVSRPLRAVGEKNLTTRAGNVVVDGRAGALPLPVPPPGSVPGAGLSCGRGGVRMPSNHRSSCERTRVPLMGLGFAGFLAIAGSGEAQTKAGEEAIAKAAAAKGRTTYVRYCVSCHGSEARGDGPLAKELRVPVADLTTLAARSGATYPYDRVVRVISKGSVVRGHGTDDMPAWGTAFNRTDGTEAAVDEAIRNLAKYLGSLQRSK